MQTMHHTRGVVIKRVTCDFKTLDRLAAGLSNEEWEWLLRLPESDGPWTGRHYKQIHI
jgi:hypothetical protein